MFEHKGLNWCQILGKAPESELCRGSSRALCWFSAAAVQEVTGGRAVTACWGHC